MQERRTTIRVPYACRAQLCQADDFLPRDGRLFNVSERGAGLLVRSLPKHGERLTVSFSLPGTEEPVIATGIVRWSDPPSPRSRWHPLGLEWLPLEDATRSRLHAFIYAATQQSSAVAVARPAIPWVGRSAMRRVLLTLALLGVAIAGGLSYLWILSLQGENRTLSTALSQRDGMIGTLQQQRHQLTAELGSAKASLASTTMEVARLDQQAQRLSTDMGRLSDEVQQAHDSYSQVSDERDRLMQRVLDLEQERTSLTAPLASVDALRVAIREAIEARRQAETARRQSLVQERRAAELQLVADGNQGYLVRDGKPTMGQNVGAGGGLVIRVLEPQAQPARPPAAPSAVPQ